MRDHQWAVPVLVKCCLNGARDPSEHPRLPVTAGQLAGEALAAVRAGAGALHLHPRDLDGRETLEPAWCDAAVTAVRSACRGIPVGLSTGSWIERSPKRRLEMIRGWRVPPDFVSVNLSEEGWEELVAGLPAAVGWEAGLWSPADAGRLSRWRGRPPLRVLVEAHDVEPEAACAAAVEIDRAVAIDAPRLHHGLGPATWAVLQQAVRLGRDIRVGLEDVLTLPDGSPAAGNADLVAEAVRIARAG